MDKKDVYPIKSGKVWQKFYNINKFTTKDWFDIGKINQMLERTTCSKHFYRSSDDKKEKLKLIVLEM